MHRVVLLTVAMGAVRASNTTTRPKDVAGQETVNEKAVTLKPIFLWPGGVVPYEFCSNITTKQERLIRKSMSDFHNRTCVRFVKRTNESNYVLIVPDDAGCSSPVGMKGGMQTLILEEDKCMYVGTVIHELMHILGFFHEHSRIDRSKYVTINFRNVLPDRRSDFKKDPRQRLLGVGYNYASIMHYGPYAFSKKPGVKKTIVPKDPRAVIKDPWQRKKMTDKDAIRVNKMYRHLC